MANDSIKMQGIIKEVHSTTEYDVELENGHIVKAKVSGKMRVNHIRMYKGDKVELEVSTYDPKRGRITYRR